MEKGMRSRRGILVTIEGATGSGKSYFVEKLGKILRSNSKSTLHEVGGFLDRENEETSDITKFLRELMRASRFIGLPWLCETTILMAEQAYNMEKYVLPGIAAKEIVLYENHDDALIAYQLVRGEELDIPTKNLNKILIDLLNLQYKPFNYPKPNLTLYLRSPLETICNRLKTRERRSVSRRDKKLIEKIRRKYEIMYHQRDGLICIENHINTDLSLECKNVAKEILKLTKV